MCLLFDCFTFSDAQYERDKAKAKAKPTPSPQYQYVWTGSIWVLKDVATGNAVPMQPMQPVPITCPISVAPITAPVNPVVVQQQPAVQPVMIANPAVPAPAAQVMVPAGGAQVMPIASNATPGFIAPGVPAQPPVHLEPVMGVGLTPSETAADNMRIAQDNRAYEPQDYKPADPDPYRLYWFRELNGHWALFQRRQIDRLCARWYRDNNGVFYAIRLQE